MKRKISFILAAFFAFVSVVALAEPMEEISDVQRRSIRIRAVGDLMMHARQLELARTDDGYDFHPEYEFVTESLSNADYTIGNLETTVGLYGNQPYSGYPRFNAPESLLQAIKDSGIDFLTLANNHMLDRYFDGMRITVDNVEAFGFEHVGAYRTREESEEPVIVDVDGIKLGFLAYTEHTNGMEAFSNAEATQYGIKYLKNADFSADVKALRDAGADFVICLPHWGTEYKRAPDANVRACAEKMVKAGVDAIIGSHPHMVQPVEYLTVDTPEGKKTALVAWSLGNFVDNMQIRYTDSGIILDFCIVEGDEGYFATDAGYVPIYCWRADKRICALPSGMYLENRPEGMGDAVYSRMKESHAELVKLIGDEIRLIDR